MRIGIHTHNQGTLEKTALRAHELGANTFQIFSASPRMWRATPPDPEDARRLRRARDKLDLSPLAIHCNYLINLASIDPVIRARSVSAFRGELDRARIIGAEYLVLHPGSHRDQTIEEGIHQFARGVAEAARGFKAAKLILLLEGTAGSGSAIGSRFEELRTIRDLAATLTSLPLAYCLDTCHLLAAGYDIATAAGLRQTLAEAARTLGIENIRLIHANDSKTPLGSRRDRHENIGEGYIGVEGFRRILRQPRLRQIPFILETPVEEENDDRRNLETLKTLCPKSRTTTARSS
ncbi:MAG: deoxyribonuclease IV [Candidatus Solibacter usitatus]|nr:deoxyribonuclease IV [Candidatus Solibacter usitatus]